MLLPSSESQCRKCVLLLSFISSPTKSLYFEKMVGQGRLELPTSRLSSARSNQLSYRPVSYRPNPRPTSCHKTPNLQHWWSRTGSNRRPPACKAGALPAELWPHMRRCAIGFHGETPTTRVLSANARRGSTLFLFQNWFFGMVKLTQ